MFKIFVLCLKASIFDVSTRFLSIVCDDHLCVLLCWLNGGLMCGADDVFHSYNYPFVVFVCCLFVVDVVC